MKIKLTVVLFCITCVSLAQSIVWQKSLGGTGYDASFRPALTSDGGYIVPAQTSSTDGDITSTHGGFNEGWLVKLNAAGSIQWQKTFGGTAEDALLAVTQTADGGYIAIGYSNSDDFDVPLNHGNDDIWVIKVNASGTLVWKKAFGGSGYEYVAYVLATADGGCIMAGATESADGDVTGAHGNMDVWLVKISSTGALQWQKTYGGTEDDYGYCINATADGGYIIGGASASTDGDIVTNHGDVDGWVIKVNASGTIQWQKTYGGSGEELVSLVEQNADGTYILTGYTTSADGDFTSNNGSEDVFVMKLNATGSIVWQKVYGGTDDDEGFSIKPITGGYLLHGYTWSDDVDMADNHGGSDLWLARLNSTGDVQWKKCYGGSFSDDAGIALPTSDGGCFMAGGSASMDGDVTGNHGTSDVWAVKIGTLASVEEPEALADRIYPNPATDKLIVESAFSQGNLTYTVTDAMGRVALVQQAALARVELAVSQLQSGIYTLTITGNERSETHRVFVQH